MQVLYARAGAILATHDDDQGIRPAVYGADVVALPWAKPLDVEGSPPVPKRVGPAPPAGQPDTRPYAMPAYVAADLYAAASFLRWVRETGGITYGGLQVSTSDRSKTLIFGAADTLGDDEVTSFPINGGAQSIAVTGVQMRTLKTAIAAHVAACFAAWNAIRLKIESGEIATLEQLYAAPGWPTA